MTKGPGEDDYVGYGSPPKATRFKVGNCEHLKRRKRKPPQLADVARSFLEESITYRTGRKLKRGRRIDVHLKKIQAAALKGDLSAISVLMDMHEKSASFVDLQKIVLIMYENDALI